MIFNFEWRNVLRQLLIKVPIKKKIDKWHERSDFIMPVFKNSSEISMIMTLPVIVADF